jgi:hypothetical protein
MPMSEGFIRRWAEKQFSNPPRAIVLSHGHFDHVSSAKALADHWNVPIYAHALERPYLTGKKEYPAPNAGAGGGMMSLLSPLLPRGPIDLGQRLRDLPASQGDAAFSELPDWQILHTGHTPGHVSFFRAGDRTLLAPTLSAPPSQSRSSKQPSRKKQKCTARLPTSLRIGTARVTQCGVLRLSIPRLSLPVTVSRSLDPRLRRSCGNWRRVSMR